MIPEVETWAKQWLSGEDRTKETVDTVIDTIRIKAIDEIASWTTRIIIRITLSTALWAIAEDAQGVAMLVVEAAGIAVKKGTSIATAWNTEQAAQLADIREIMK